MKLNVNSEFTIVTSQDAAVKIKKPQEATVGCTMKIGKISKKRSHLPIFNLCSDC